jgi:hypothetical protein
MLACLSPMLSIFFLSFKCQLLIFVLFMPDFVLEGSVGTPFEGNYNTYFELPSLCAAHLQSVLYLIT